MEGDYEKGDEEKGLPPESTHSPRHPRHPLHYYGDIVRQTLFAIGILMIIGVPLFSQKINFSSFFILLGIIGVNLFAGLTNPKQRTTIWGDFIVSLIGLVFFELIAFFYFAFYQVADLYFWFNQLLAILFFISLYFSVKTLRGMMVKEIEKIEEEIEEDL